MPVLVHVEQTCTIGDRDYNVHGSSVQSALNQVLRMSLTIDVDANAAATVPQIGEVVVLTQTGNGTQTFRARVIRVSPTRGANWTRYDIDAEGLAGAAAHRRILNVFPPQTAQALVQTNWNFYGDGFVSYVADDVSDPVEIEEYTSTYDSLLDLLNFAANATGWSWLSEGSTLRFFDPVNFPVSGTLVQRNFARGTLKATRSSESLYNVARQQAWEYATVNFTTPIIPENIRRRAFDTVQVIYCATRFSGPPNLSGESYDLWEFASGRVLQGTPAAGINNPPLADIEVGFADEDRHVTTNVALMAPPNADLAFAYRVNIEATFRKLVWTEVRDSGSIAQYGVREAPVLPNDGGVDVPESLRRLEEYLLQRAQPPVDLEGEYLRTDIHPGERRAVNLPDLGINRDFVVESVTRQYGADGLTVRVSMRSVLETSRDVTAARRRPDPLPEVFRRIEKLESSRLSPASAAGAVWIDTTPIRGVATFEGAYSWSGEFEIEPLVTGITIEEDF